MALLNPGYIKNNYIQDKEEYSLRSFLLPLISNNNVTKILSHREMGENKIKKKNNDGINFHSSYNFKQRRFIISGQDCFTKMWNVIDIIYTFLCDHNLIDHKDHSKKKITNTIAKTKKSSIDYIQKKCNLYNIKDQIYIIEKNQALDNQDIDKINRCFMLFVIDYSDEFSRDIRGNTEYFQQQYDIRVSNPRVNSIITDELNWRGQTEQMPFQETVLSEILTVYNFQEKQEVSVLHKNICYVSIQKVLHHNSWIDISNAY